MMSRSFGEVDHQKRVSDIKVELEEVEKKLEKLGKDELSSYLQPLVKFYDIASAYMDQRKYLMTDLLASPKVQKYIVPGAVILITYKSHINKLSLVLSIDRSKKSIAYKVLVLTDSQPKNSKLEDNQTDFWYQMLALTKDKVFVPNTANIGHEVLTISALDIFEITSKVVKIRTDIIVQDWQKRQIERFRNDPPGQTCTQAIQELLKLSILTNEDRQNNVLTQLHFLKDLNVNEHNLYFSLTKMYELKEKLFDHLSSTQIPNFEEQFQAVFERKFLEEKRKDLEFQLSNASLILYPDYERRIKLLRKLHYVDPNNRVKLKGKVACEMGMNELLITELVLEDVFINLQASEVAALLSALVFRVKRRENVEFEEELTPTLKEGIQKIQSHHEKIAAMELELGIQTDEFQTDLNFGLVHIVYRWANHEEFSEIMKLTDIQEGTIVRCIQQLNDTIIDVREAAKIIGDPALQKKMEDASACIKRNIVFAESLYTQDFKCDILK